jgi:hypothetical protein
MLQTQSELAHNLDRRSFIGGSDARIIMGDDESNLVSWSRLSEQNLRVDKWSLCRV